MPLDYVDIEPASIAQIRKSLKGELILIDDDVQGIAAALREVNDDFRLHYDPYQDIWVVMQLHDGQEKLVTTHTGDLDHRLVQRVRQVAARGYDYAAELERSEREAERKRDRDRRESIGPIGERLAHAMAKDLGYDGNRAFIKDSKI